VRHTRRTPTRIFTFQTKIRDLEEDSFSSPNVERLLAIKSYLSVKINNFRPIKNSPFFEFSSRLRILSVSRGLVDPMAQ
jgi:hypothetical protein